MGSSSDIDVSVANVYHAWKLFRRGKKPSWELEAFQFNLEANLLSLALDLQKGTYEHGSYRHFEVHDNKKRVVAVASVRDRVVHRLLYEFLVPIWDTHFSYDVWSCRPGKGLLGAIERTQTLMTAHYNGWLWRADIAKFFDNIDHQVMKTCIRRRVSGEKANFLLDKVIDSYVHNKESVSQSVSQSVIGLPIGNLTSQILANIYLNEFDRFVQHDLKPLGYVRYGDDFILWTKDEQTAFDFQQRGQAFLIDTLHLSLHTVNHALQPSHPKLHFLGIEFWPGGHRLDKRMRSRIVTHTNPKNIASYQALIKHHWNKKAQKRFVWGNIIDRSF